MTVHSKTQAVISSPISLAIWGAVIAILSLVFAFELLPLPQKMNPISETSFVQAPDGSDANSVPLPDNWRSYPDRAIAPGTYRFSIAAPPEREAWGVFIPNYSG